ncbi:hypothetical protein ON010_g1652 [Phytophthora cinnamomi]|nr:hypothetical protein ON010_g1652 [Phytophthora cinnamomi]
MAGQRKGSKAIDGIIVRQSTRDRPAQAHQEDAGDKRQGPRQEAPDHVRHPQTAEKRPGRGGGQAREAARVAQAPDTAAAGRGQHDHQTHRSSQFGLARKRTGAARGDRWHPGHAGFAHGEACTSAVADVENLQLFFFGTAAANVVVVAPHTQLHSPGDRPEAWDQDLDTESTVSQENRFESLDGGFSVVRFDNAPLPSTTVKAVFDAITHSMQNAEIIISELFGSITIREDTEFEAADISQLRLVSSTSHGATVESNSVVFAEFVDTPEECFGIVVADFVDADELYPYRPAERVRRDAITLVLIRALPSHDYEKKVVVGTRWTCLKLAHSELDVPKEGLAELQESSMAWGDTMKKCILKHLAKSEAENGIKWT